MWFYLISAGVILLDQGVKAYMGKILPLCEPGACPSIDILPVFKLTLLHNEGAAFSFLAEAGGWQRWALVTISATVSTVVGVWLYRVRHTEKLLSVALALVLGGAIGNLIDRAVTGYVVDFFLFYYRDWYFPAFNVADSAISVGATLLVLDMLMKPRSPGHPAHD